MYIYTYIYTTRSWSFALRSFGAPSFPPNENQIAERRGGLDV